MFGKLLKYEFKSQQKLLTILSFAVLGAGVLGGFAVWLMMNAIDNVENETASAVGGVLGGLLIIGIVLAVAAYVIAVWIMLLYRFYKHHFSQEGYLTFTLPVTTHQILWASIVNIVIWSLISLVVTLCAMCIMLTPVFLKLISESGLELDMLFSVYKEMFSYMEDGQMAVQILASVVGAVYSLIIPLACIAVGSLLTKKYRILASIGLYYGIHMAVSIFSGVFTVIVTVAGISAGDDGMGMIWLSILGPCVLQLALTVGGYFLMHRMMDKKLNLP